MVVNTQLLCISTVVKIVGRCLKRVAAYLSVKFLNNLENDTTYL